MVIGIDASRAFLKRRTGIEEYSYQTIKHLRDALPASEHVVLYVRRKFHFHQGRLRPSGPSIDFTLPKNWEVRGIWAPRFWTQIGLSLEMLFRAPDILFVPAHTVPLIHPKRTIVTVHGLEYEFCPTAYSFWERLYMRYSIRFSCRSASRIICVSENTKQDVMRLYQVPPEKISVIAEGYEESYTVSKSAEMLSHPNLLFIGRLEERKNIVRIIQAFEMLKEKYRIPHKLILAGKPGYGYEKITEKLSQSAYSSEIVEKGYVSEEEKWQLLKQADVFLFPTLYEGFGIPVLEAQSMRVPVVTSNSSSLPEIAGEGAVLVDPTDPESVAEGAYRLLSDGVFRDGIIEKATANVGRFSWEQCVKGVSELLLK
jgi:glycosyltransferase involved in cell wall biosynthesis